MPRPVAVRRPSRDRLLLHGLHLTLELAGSPQRQTTLGVLGQVATPLELAAELRGQDHPALGVERVLVPPNEACHQLCLPRRSLACVL